MLRQLQLEFSAWVLRILSLLNLGSLGDRHADLGLLALDGSAYEQAVSHLEQAVAKGVERHELPMIQIYLGRAYRSLGQLKESAAALRKAIEIEPEDPIAWNDLGVTHAHLGNFEEAEQHYRESIRLEPKYAYAFASLGALYIRRNEPFKAVETLQKAIELDATAAVAHANLALALATLGELDEAEAALKQAIAHGYDHWESIQARIMSLRVQSRWVVQGRREDPEQTDWPAGWYMTQCAACGHWSKTSRAGWADGLLGHCPNCGQPL